MARITIASEISAKVWKIAAGPGTRLEEDDPIIVLESMKMEIPVAAPRACTVAEILVAEGETVEEGQAVAVVEA